MSEMQAGRELDALVAETVMGLTVNRRDGGPWHLVNAPYQERGRCCGSGLPKYSEDIAAAWEVVEKLSPANRGDGAHLACIIVNAPHGEGQFPDDCPTGVWSVEWYDGVDTLDAVSAATAPLAICLAALRVVAALSGEHKDEAKP